MPYNNSLYGDRIMSWLMRNGTGRNNIAWGGGNTTKANYLRRTASGRNDISFINVTSNGTHNLLERTDTGRNNIRWNNLAFNFFSFSDYPSNSSTLYIAIGKGTRNKLEYKIISYLSDGYQVTYDDDWEEYDQYFDGIHYYVSIIFAKSSGLADRFIGAFNVMGYTKIKLSTTYNWTFTINIQSAFAGKIWTTTKQGVFQVDMSNNVAYSDFVEAERSYISKVQFL